MKPNDSPFAAIEFRGWKACPAPENDSPLEQLSYVLCRLSLCKERQEKLTQEVLYWTQKRDELNHLWAKDVAVEVVKNASPAEGPG